MKIILSSILLILLVSGCTHTTGKRIDMSGVRSFELNRTTPAQAVALLGEPPSVDTKTKRGITYTGYFYSYGMAGPTVSGGHRTMQVCLLEFVDDRLHAYLLDDFSVRVRKELDLAVASSLVIGSSTKQDVINLWGQPDGKALTPTNLEAFQNIRGHEVWVWYGMYKVNLRVQKLLVGFDASGRVVSVLANQNRERIYKAP